jgi:hypothetical protein
MTAQVWLVVETYRYEDERGGVTVAAFAGAYSAQSDCNARREAPDRCRDYDYDVVEFVVYP